MFKKYLDLYIKSFNLKKVSDTKLNRYGIYLINYSLGSK